MEHYSKGKNVEEPLTRENVPIPDLPKNFLWMHVSGGSKMRNLLTPALKAFKDDGVIVWTGSGLAIGKTISCAEIMKRNFKQVAWVRIDTQTILTIHDHVITQDPRITLSHTDHRSWYLHVREVQESDRGWYLCQINTDPMRSTQGYVQVVVPPTIVDEETSADLVVREMVNVTLTCKAEGFPEPTIMWRREDGEEFIFNGESVSYVDGEVLHLTRVSRLHIGAYLCIASNGVPPSISKRVQLRVHFPPMLSIPNQLEGAYLGQDVSLECHSEAYPSSINYWTTSTGEMIISGDKYEVVAMDNGYNKYMMLKIRNMGRSDFGIYNCIAKNSLGETDGVIRLDGEALVANQQTARDNPRKYRSLIGYEALACKESIQIPVPTTLSTTTVSPLLSTTPRKRVRHRDRPLEHQELNVFGLEEWRGTDYDDEEYVFPSVGPHSAHHPPGAYSGASRRLLPGAWLTTLFLCCVLLPSGR